MGGGDGDIPSTALIQATDGSLYGTTYGGGANTRGTIFKISPDGELSTLYDFCSRSNPELICFGFARDESLAPPMSPRDTTSRLRSDSRFAGCRRRCR